MICLHLFFCLFWSSFKRWQFSCSNSVYQFLTHYSIFIQFLFIFIFLNLLNLHESHEWILSVLKIMTITNASSEIVLSFKKNWDEWFVSVMIVTEISEIQDLIDLNKTNMTMMLKKSEWSIRLVNNIEYSNKLNEYKFDYCLYEKSVKRIATVEQHIMNTITHMLFVQMTDCQTVQKRLQILKRWLTSTDLIRENNIISRYQALKKSTWNKNLHNWLNKWMKVIADCQKLSLSEKTTFKTVTDFLNTLNDIHSSFAV